MSGHQHLDQRQEDALGGVADRAVLLRRLRRDDRVVDRVALGRHALHVQHRERLDRRVEAGVVAERALRVRARPARRSPRARPGRAPAPAAARSGSRPSRPARPAGTRRTGTRRCRPAAAPTPRTRRPGRSRTRSPPAAAGRSRSATAWCAVESLWICQCMPSVLRRVLLQPVEAEVALAGLRVLGVGQPVVVEDAAVVGPGLQAGQPVQVDVGIPCRRPPGTARVFTLFGGTDLSCISLPSPSRMPAQPDRQLRLDELADAGADLVDVVDAERHRHPPVGAEEVDRDRHRRRGSGCSNSSAGPFARTVRVTISLISSVGSTGAPSPGAARPRLLQRGEELLRSEYGKPGCAMATSRRLTRPTGAG